MDIFSSKEMKELKGFLSLQLAPLLSCRTPFIHLPPQRIKHGKQSMEVTYISRNSQFQFKTDVPALIHITV